MTSGKPWGYLEKFTLANNSRIVLPSVNKVDTFHRILLILVIYHLQRLIKG